MIVGRGTEEAALKKQAKTLGIGGRVTFKDWTETPREELARWDIFLMPSLREGCPTILLEAFSVGTAVVASDIPGINEIVQDGINGFLVDTRAPEKFAEKIVLLAENPALIRRFGEEGYKTVQQNFSIGREMAQWGELYRRAHS